MNKKPTMNNEANDEATKPTMNYQANLKLQLLKKENELAEERLQQALELKQLEYKLKEEQHILKLKLQHIQQLHETTLEAINKKPTMNNEANDEATKPTMNYQANLKLQLLKKENELAEERLQQALELKQLEYKLKEEQHILKLKLQHIQQLQIKDLQVTMGLLLFLFIGHIG